MSFYKNTTCHVCGKEFKDDDDIVTCPECGTPHHRECYESLGKCANEELHKDGFDYYDSHKKELNKDDNPKAEKSNTKSVNDLESKIPSPFSQPQPGFYTSYDNDHDKIDGKNVNEVALSIGVNAQSFIPKFKQLSKKEKKFKWNWCAFIFGPFYMLFRKMYKAGIAFFTANIMTALISGAACFKFAPESASLYMKAMSGELAEGATTLAEQTVALQEGLQTMPDVATFVTIVNIATIILFAIKILAGMITNSLYKTQVIKNIDKVESDIEKGIGTQNLFVYGMGQMPSGDDLKKILLVKKGSVNFFAPLLAYFAIEAIMIFITSIM